MKKYFFGFLILFGTLNSFSQTPPLKEWTVLVYLNADNNLYPFSLTNFAQMEKVGSSDQVNIVVQMDPAPKALPTTRYYVTRNANPRPGQITSQVISQGTETNMGSWNTLADFLSWGVKTYPAKKYLVVVWNHGNGWQGISYDDNPKAYIRMPELRQALEVANKNFKGRGPIDVVNFDACLMSTLEVGYELRGNAQYMVGSQFLEPGAGEDYAAFLSPLVEKPQMTAKELSAIMVYQYVRTYSGNREINYAAVDLTKVAPFTTHLNGLSVAMKASPLAGNIQRALINGKDSGFDLISAFTQVEEIASPEPPLQQNVSALLQMYGYPKEAQLNRRSLGALSMRTFTVSRFYPGVVHFRAGNRPWQKVPLAKQSNGSYQVELPVGVSQYFVSYGRPLRASSHEALTTLLRTSTGEITYHTDFPATSPLIADAYSSRSKGAHGMTLYSLAGLKPATLPGEPKGQGSILTEYKLLQFAQQGAPAWTAFFGF